jgi:lipid-binding SYLF domain-containing protein
MKFYASLLLVFLFSLCVFSQNQKDLATAFVRAEKSAEILKQFAALGSDSVPVEYLKKAKAVAVFPGLTRVNILLNELTLGNGIVSVRSADGNWSVPAFLAFKAQDVNLKMAGKKSFDVVILFKDDQSIEWLKKGDIGFTSGGKRKIAIGPVIGGKGADEVMKTANVIYYAFNQGQLIDTGLSNDSVFKAVGVLHDNNMNKAVFGMKTKQLFATPESNLKIPEKVEKYRSVLKEILAENPPQ